MASRNSAGSCSIVTSLSMWIEALSRRKFLSQCWNGAGSIAFTSMLLHDAARAALVNPLAPKRPHHPPKVKNCQDCDWRRPRAFSGSIAARRRSWLGGVREGVVRPDFADFAPRVGVAYRLGTRVAIRAGYGIFYAMNQGNDSKSISQNPGASVQTSSTNSPGRPPRLMDTLFDSAFETVRRWHPPLYDRSRKAHPLHAAVDVQRPARTALGPSV